MKKNLIISGGIFHPFEDTSNSLSKILPPLPNFNTSLLNNIKINEHPPIDISYKFN